jgi:hypothetical protein
VGGFRGFMRFCFGHFRFGVNGVLSGVLWDVFVVLRWGVWKECEFADI